MAKSGADLKFLVQIKRPCIQNGYHLDARLSNIATPSFAVLILSSRYHVSEER